MSLPARSKPIRECLSIGARNLAGFPRPAQARGIWIERESCTPVVADPLRLSNTAYSGEGKLNKPLMAVPQ